MEEKTQQTDEDFVPSMKSYMLTTIDNPFHPLDQYEDWLRYDEDHGYFTNEYLARIASESIYLTDAENQMIVNAAINEICRLDILGIYKRVIVDD